MIKKSKYPILEHDTNQDAKINPEIFKNKYPALPERLIITFFKDAIEHLITTHRITHLLTISGENDLIVYKFIEEDVIIIHGSIGAPACAGYYEELIALGVKKTMFCGGGGALRSDLTVGKLIVVDSAIRDEGFSYHYFAASRYIEADKTTVTAIKNYLNSKDIEFIVGRTWTTDAFYRETQDKINLRKEEEALIVEMEQSALLAVAKYRNVKYGGILYSGDDLSQDIWDSRGWKKRSDIRSALIEICLDLVKKI